MIAAYDGQEEMVKYVCNQCRVDPFVKSSNVR